MLSFLPPTVTPVEAFRVVCAVIAIAYTIRVFFRVLHDYRIEPSARSYVNLVTHIARVTGIWLLTIVAVIACFFGRIWSPGWTGFSQICSTLVIINMGFISWWTSRGKKKAGANRALEES